MSESEDNSLKLGGSKLGRKRSNYIARGNTTSGIYATKTNLPPFIPDNFTKANAPPARARLNSISKEEQDAALNLVSLFRQNNSIDSGSSVSSGALSNQEERAPLPKSALPHQANVPYAGLAFNPHSCTRSNPPLSPRSLAQQPRAPLQPQPQAQAPLLHKYEYYQPQFHPRGGYGGSSSSNSNYTNHGAQHMPHQGRYQYY
mmetsp:Transcript_9737/g.14328  ORF Transcript_9737/g.14328 Transcript_9737/m.14328 type:complete len:202 (-) Transcript_9737:45-650(-)